MSQAESDRSLAEKVKYVDYEIPETALGKWADQCLTCLADEGDKRRYRFIFEGSTCMDGGEPYNAHIQVLLEGTERGVVVADGLISFAEEDMDAAKKMCEYLGEGEEFFQALQKAPPFCGRTLEEILAEPMPVNPAGCFCTEPMVNHKWRLALSTLHYALAQEAAAQDEIRV
ncbi:MAG: hypothetical protein HOC74_08365 [Gemmatimonadetes bacterium]|jgi:hypothetical protein|nr:hypothetical protein [Gemmatimonadota bacterium]